MRAGSLKSQWRKRSPGLIEIVIGMGQDLVYMLSEKFPEKVKVSQVVSQPEEQSLLEASFLREMGGHTLSKTQIGILGRAYKGVC
jgi:hypothetical protein